jgi:OOP family OmpA-OmpF porin
MTLSAAIAAALPVAARADGFYIGAGVGSATYESADFIDCFGECRTFKDSDIAYNIFAGWQVTDAVAVELGYHDWGEGEDSIDFAEKAKVEPSLVTLMAVGTAPVTENFSVFGKAGIAFLSIDATIVDGGEGSGSSDSQELALGGGVQWNLGNFGIRGDLLWVDAEDADQAMMYGISALWQFGRSNK